MSAVFGSARDPLHPVSGYAHVIHAGRATGLPAYGRAGNRNALNSLIFGVMGKVLFLREQERLYVDPLTYYP